MDKTEIIKIYHEDFVYRHTNYWDLVYKSMLAILGLLALPYFLFSTIGIPALLSLFPILGFFVCIFSIILLDSEALRMTATRKRLNGILGNDYKEIDIADLLTYKKGKKRKMTLYSKILYGSITKKVRYLYVILSVISLTEMVLIITKVIFSSPVTP